MKITAITAQQKLPHRVNIFVDGVYRLSLDIAQIVEMEIKIGKEYTEEELSAIENESMFGKLYTRTLEYCFKRPHSAKEVRDYLYKKTRDSRNKDGSVKKGISPDITERVYKRLHERGYIDDEKFTRFWIENRQLRKGISERKLRLELQQKGIEKSIIETVLSENIRNETEEIQKIIAKKRNKYPDDMKLKQYLLRQGFSYDDIKSALS